jgi:hypothetical protein
MLANWRGARSRVERQAVVLDRVFGTPERTLSHATAQNTCARGLDHSIWSFERTTGAEHELLAASTWNSPRLVGIGADGRLLVERCLAPFQASPKPCARIVEWHPADPALDTRGAVVLPLPDYDKVVLSPDGTRLVVNTPPHDKQTYSVSPFGVLMQILNLQTFVTDAGAARARTDLPPCDRPVWSPDRSRLACATGQAITMCSLLALCASRSVALGPDVDPTLRAAAEARSAARRAGDADTYRR